MDRAELLAILELEHAEFRRLVDAVGFERMHLPGVSGHYSVKDIVAHLAAYERALVRWLKAARAGRVYVDDVLDGPDVDARNSVVYEASKDNSAALIVETFDKTFDELLQCVHQFSDKELADAGLSAWFVVPRWHREQALWKCIANDSYEHYHQHIPDIRRWLAQKRQDGESGQQPWSSC